MSILRRGTGGYPRLLGQGKFTAVIDNNAFTFASTLGPVREELSWLGGSHPIPQLPTAML